MAARSFLLSDDILEGRKILLRGVQFPAGAATNRRRFSDWLAEKLMGRLREIGPFEGLDPVFLGSWSRNELCPKSDIDLLFLGPEEKVAVFVREAFREGLKLRARTPADSRDWSVGVEPFDVLALQSAQALNSEAHVRLEEQRQLVLKHRRKILSAIRCERAERRGRQDSVSNYLEPNLKFGAGGLRDIEQALALAGIYPEFFRAQDTYPFKALREIKDEFLFLRALLHLGGSGDTLTAHDQHELARELKMESPAALMKLVQSELERASFYADWVVEVCVRRAPPPDVVQNIESGLKRLKADPGLMTQFAIRRRVEDLHKGMSVEARGRILQKALSGSVEDDYLVGLHRSRLLEMWIPDFKRVRGLVQHDHYHRFTVDAHLVQALREVERARRRPARFGRLGRLAKEFSANDWWTLKLTALFHDLAKGRGGDHSSVGAELVERYLADWGYPTPLREDVSWLVASHLLLSTAAFRQNPGSKTTWKRLFDRGVEGRRLKLLALFTAIDIRATNPDAWTDWKSQLLADLVRSMGSEEARKLKAHLAQARRMGLKRADEWMLALDPVVLDSLPPKVLVEDLAEAGRSQGDLAVKVFTQTRPRHRLWLRFHRRVDETGVFLNFVKRLYGLGLNVETASVHTLPEIGVYDWFCVRTDRSAKQVAEWLNRPGSAQPDVPAVRFQVIELMAQDQDEWIFSFRGKNQRGLLVAAADALAKENLSLRWARVHTWGQQVDDVFSVQPFGEVEAVLTGLKRRFVT